MYNPETLVTLSTRHKTKINLTKTQKTNKMCYMDPIKKPVMNQGARDVYAVSASHKTPVMLLV
jgi:hypothetical protein